MAEQILQIENVDPKELHGPNDKYLELVKSMFPKLKIIARGDFVKVIGDDDEIEYFANRYETLMVQLERFGKLTAQSCNKKCRKVMFWSSVAAAYLSRPSLPTKNAW